MRSPPPAANQLGQDQADLQGLAEPHSVRQQEPRLKIRRIEGLRHGALLIAERLGQHVPRHRQ